MVIFYFFIYDNIYKYLYDKYIKSNIEKELERYRADLLDHSNTDIEDIHDDHLYHANILFKLVSLFLLKKDDNKKFFSIFLKNGFGLPKKIIYILI